MHSAWNNLRTSLLLSVSTRRAKVEFAELRTSCRALATFSDARAVLAFTQRHGNLDQKDRVFGALVAIVQSGQLSEAPRTLLWLGLWPGLSAVHRRQSRFFRDHPDELVSLICAAFTELVDQLDLETTRRIAASLVWGTHRKVSRSRQRQECEQRFFHFDDAPEPSATTALERSTISEATALQQALAATVGRDAELLVAVTVLGLKLSEAAGLFGLSHDAARQRYCRALKRLREKPRGRLSDLTHQVGEHVA